MVWICLLAPDTSACVFIWDCEGPQQAKCHFKDYEVGASCTALLIVLSLWEHGVFIQFCGHCLLFLGAVLEGGENQGVPHGLTAKVMRGMCLYNFVAIVCSS